LTSAYITVSYKDIIVPLKDIIFIFIHHKGSTESNNEIIQYTIATAQ